MVDGYMGMYDTVIVAAGERDQRIEPDFWLLPDNIATASVNRDEIAGFLYELDNRRFSGYAADVEISAWRSQQKVRDIMSQRVTLGAFDTGRLMWTLDPKTLAPPDLPQEQSFDFTIVIKRGTVERRLVVFVSPSLISKPGQPIPAPVR